VDSPAVEGPGAQPAARLRSYKSEVNLSCTIRAFVFRSTIEHLSIVLVVGKWQQTEAPTNQFFATITMTTD
jgi:hypothetical protein